MVLTSALCAVQVPKGNRVLREAARQLPSATAEKALTAAWSRLRRRPGRQTQLAVWIRALLISHAAHLQTSAGGIFAHNLSSIVDELETL